MMPHVNIYLYDNVLGKGCTEARQLLPATFSKYKVGIMQQLGIEDS